MKKWMLRWRGWQVVACLSVAVALLLTGVTATVQATVRKSIPTSSAEGSDHASQKPELPVVRAANAFLATLSPAEKEKILVPFTKENAIRWSNLPCGTYCRGGIEFKDLTPEQIAAAKNVVRVALNTSKGVGYDQVMQVVAADDVLQYSQTTGAGGAAPPKAPPAGSKPPAGMDPNAGPLAYGSKLYTLVFVGAPSSTGTWELHFGGHHVAVNLTYHNGKLTGESPFFIGVEPSWWKAKNGETYSPLATMRSSLKAAINSLAPFQLSRAKLPVSFTDVYLGPGKDGQFPKKKSGIPLTELLPYQRDLVVKAIEQWVSVADKKSAARLLNIYKSELNQTYLAYSHGTSLTQHGDYIRIDGPSVWIEFVCQQGVVFNKRIHYHTIYRDHLRDYGGELHFS
ncbi:MAG: DUF3500 domain-containing protein [Gordonia sp. (in: high G+C Gram-positive bacteria)]